MNTQPKTLQELFDTVGKIKVPSYQRAYAWEQDQLKDFVADLLEITETEGREYYYGHFVLEQTDDGYTNVIDGQQRLTTFILFLLACQSFGRENLELYINRFETVNYDTSNFDIIKKAIRNSPDWDLKSLETQLDSATTTLSIKRILFALDYFRKSFASESATSLRDTDIPKYIDALLNASISCHLTKSKAVAAQIFELHNSRGIQLTVLEKVKSKLMKAAYVCDAPSEESEVAVSKIQNHFAEIYRLEESLSAAVFRGNLSLEGLLFHHLRIVDDGSKVTNVKNGFGEPSRHGNREEIILHYIGKRLAQGNVLAYATGLAEKFEQSVRFISTELPKLDEENRLLGDAMILDRGLSTEFLLLLHFKGFDASLKNSLVLRLWEVLLFTRDFHGKYYNLKGSRDNFEEFFQRIAAKSEEEILKTLAGYVEKGFRADRMDKESLPLTVSNYIQSNKTKFLDGAFDFWRGKVNYILYKYELREGASLQDLRTVVREGFSTEHILPREWDWIKEGEDYVAANDILKKEVNRSINGLGNLLIISEAENKSLSNNHPCDKRYKSIAGGTYSKHNNTAKQEWENPEKWSSLISARGEKIYAFLEEFVKPPIVEEIS